MYNNSMNKLLILVFTLLMLTTPAAAAVPVTSWAWTGGGSLALDGQGASFQSIVLSGNLVHFDMYTTWFWSHYVAFTRRLQHSAGSVSAIPEPSAGWLMLAGALAVAYLSKRRLPGSTVQM